LGINVLLHNKRNEFERNQNQISLFDRLEIFQKIDKDLLEYYEHINQRLGRQYLSFSYPILYDYIRNESYCFYRGHTYKLNELNVAFKLRQQKDVVQFRDEIEHLEFIINRGNTQALLSQLQLLDDIAKDLTNKYNKSILLAEFKLSLSPSLSRTFPIKIKLNKNMQIHTSFIKKVYSFGINERVNKFD